MSKGKLKRPFTFWYGISSYSKDESSKYCDLNLDGHLQEIASAKRVNGKWVIEKPMGVIYSTKKLPLGPESLPTSIEVISDEKHHRALELIRRFELEEKKIRDIYQNEDWITLSNVWEAVKYANRGCSWACLPEKGWTIDRIAEEAERQYGINEESHDALLKKTREIVEELRIDPRQSGVFSLYESNVGQGRPYIVHEKYVGYILSSLGDYIFTNIYKDKNHQTLFQKIKNKDISRYYELLERGFGHYELNGIESIMRSALVEAERNNNSWYKAENDYIQEREQILYRVLRCPAFLIAKVDDIKEIDKDKTCAIEYYGSMATVITNTGSNYLTDIGNLQIKVAVGPLYRDSRVIGEINKKKRGRPGRSSKRYLEGRPIWVYWGTSDQGEAITSLIISDYSSEDEYLEENSDIEKEMLKISANLIQPLSIPIDCLIRAVILQSLPSHHMTGDTQSPIARYYFESMDKYPTYLGFLLHGDPNLNNMQTDAEII